MGKLPRDLFEDELVPLCEKVTEERRCLRSFQALFNRFSPCLQFGKIYEVRMMMDFSGNNRGYAFVTFSNKQEAKAAMKQLNNYEIR